MIRLEGISNRMYGAKKMVRATLGCTPLSFRSFGRPIVKAFPILTLEGRCTVSEAGRARSPVSLTGLGKRKYI